MLAFSSLFDLSGPDFLKLYWLLAVVALVAGLVVRRFFTADSGSANDTGEPTPYEVACLAGPPARAVHAAIAQLCQDGLIAVDARTGGVSFVAPGEVVGRPPIEQSVLRAVAGNNNVPLSAVEAACAPALADLQTSLRAKRMLVADDKARLGWIIPSLMIATVQIVGLIRFFIGLSRHKPVGFLVVSWLAFGFFSSLLFTKRPYRTKRGDSFLADLKAKYAELQREAAAAGTMGGPSPVFASLALPLAVGVLGYSVLAGTPADGMYQRMRGSGGDSGGIGDSSSSSGDGGGDGGGGGCGGCGGGGD
jgi:uncharacterized protein (TIGR04222 family)